MESDWTPILVIWGVMGVLGAMIGSGKKMGAGGGFFVGLILGPIGLIIVAVSAGPSTLDRIEAKPSEAGWHPDPLGRFDSRWYDGNRWTQHVGRVDGEKRTQLEDPL
jgi:hypothetical protein